MRAVKQKYPSLEVCVSAGLLDDEKAEVLKLAGLDRLNHNLNTSRARYGDICTTHTYDDRLNTLLSAKRAGLQTCSGLIAGMGESPSELVELALTLAELKAESIPVNFLLPFEGNVLDTPHGLTPAYCLRILCLFRFANPSADVRIAAGREYHLRGLEALGLLPANSLFLDGYLNGRGAERRRTYALIADAGFELVGDHAVDTLLDTLPAEDGHVGRRQLDPHPRGRGDQDDGRAASRTFLERFALPLPQPPQARTSLARSTKQATP